ncbi:MAG: response regulator [Nitrospirae bacterium]|nr:response regulator [Nitrospirota bacterium]
MAKKGEIEILVVEDSPTQAEELRYILERSGYAVHAAGNGKEALELMARSAPAIVVTDIIMPEMDGFELCKTIKADEKLRNIPVILLTALSEPEDVLKGLECGGDSFLTKPCDEGYLLGHIDHVLVNAGIRKAAKADEGEIFFKGRRYSITSGRRQILDLLISTYETAVMKNHELKKAKEKMEVLNQQLHSEIAERRRREEEVRKLNEDLRSRALQLEEANKDLEGFSYSVSHDLKAPLRAINGFSQILVEEYAGKLDDECRGLLNTIGENAKKMSRLIDDILAFSRAGRKEILMSVIDAGAMLNTLIGEMAPSYSGRTVRFELKELPPLVGDAATVQQVFFNLIANAIKFTRPREVALIEIGGEVKRNEVVYHVRDNGVGFPHEYSDKLFGVFQRLHSSGEFEGTGIGLAIVKRVINKLGGRVWAESRVNEGATFYFSLPRAAGLANRPAETD